MAGEIVQVACYYRMSTTKQDDSIDRQRSQVVPYCAKHGYTVIAEYVDEGIAGDEIIRRREFQRMLRDAQAGRFRAVVCDDADRFGRFDSIDSGEVVAPLRRKGVWLETVAQGRVDWNSFAGRITDAVLREAKNLESDAISRRVLSNQLLKAKDCIYTGGPAAYGYRWEPDSARGKRLVPDGRKAEVVQLAFKLYDQGQTLMAIMTELHRRGVPSPKGKACWTRTVIQRMLTNRRYVGDWTWGVQPQGKRHRFGVGGLTATERFGTAAARRNPADAWLVCPDTHEPLVSRDQFERVQARLRRNQTMTTPHVAGGSFVLNQLMVCGRCGSRMCGFAAYGKREYVCRGYLAHGKDYCFKNAVEEQPILRFLIRKLQTAFLDPANLAKLRKEAVTQEARERGDANLGRLRRHVAELEQKIGQGNERLVILPPDRIPGVVEQLREWEREREAVQAELRRIEADSPADRLEKAVADAEAMLWRLQEALKEADLSLLREVLREMVDRVELHWVQEQRGKRTFSRLTGGVVWLRDSQAQWKLYPSAGLSLQVIRFTADELYGTRPPQKPQRRRKTG